MKKLKFQTVICLLIAALFIVTGKAYGDKLSPYMEKVKSAVTKDYKLSELKDNAVSVVSMAVEKPKEMYGAIVEGRSEENQFTSPVDELAVSVFNGSSTSNEYRYMSDDTIVVHCTGRGMVEAVEADEDTGYYNVTVKHDNGISSKYIGCTNVYFRKSESVKQGDILGEVANSGIRKLRFEIWENGEKVNPGKYIQ